MPAKPASYRRTYTSRVRPRPEAVLVLCLLCAGAWGQERATEPAVAAPDPQAQQADRTQLAVQKTKKQKQVVGSHDRVFFALPNFLTVEDAQKVAPLTAGQKFSVTMRDTFDPVEVGWYGLQAGIAQWKDSDPSFGEGAEGYAKRFGEKFADGTIENIFTRALMPAVLHQDPRYYQLGEGRFIHRLGYAVSRIFVTRSDSGNSQFNFSEIIGAAAAAGISSYSYHPEDARNVSSCLDVWGTQVAWDTVSYAVKEFWPDIRRKIRHGKAAPGVTAKSAGG
jgi:hypothetical protein